MKSRWPYTENPSWLDQISTLAVVLGILLAVRLWVPILLEWIR